MDAGTLEIKIQTNQAEIDKLRARLDDLDGQTKKTQLGFAKLAGSFFTAQTAINLFNRGLQFGKQQFINAIRNAKDIGEETSKFGVVFKGVTGIAKKMRDELVAAYGMSRLEATKALSAFQDFLVPMGIARDEAAELSGEFTKLAVDIGSFNNQPTEVVLEAIKSGIAGMSRPMRQFGVDISETTLKAMAMAQGIELVGGVLDRQTRTQLIYQKILQDSADAYGDFARTSDQLANRQKILGSLFTDISSNLGARLLPALNDSAGAAIQLAGAFEKMTSVKLSEELEKEQTELNLLVASITAVNTPTEKRKKLIEELDKTYPGFLGKLNKEKVTNEELRQRLEEVNDAYINRIIIQKEQEAIEKEMGKVADKKRKSMTEEVRLNKEIMDLATQLGVSSSKLTGTYEEQIAILKKTLGERNALAASWTNEDDALLKIENRLKNMNSLNKQVSNSNEKLNVLQQEKKKIIDSLSISEKELNKITTKNTETKKKEIKTEKENTNSKLNLQEQIKNEIILLEHKIKVGDKEVNTTDKQILAYENIYTKLKQMGVAQEELWSIEEKLYELRKKSAEEKKPKAEGKAITYNIDLDASAFDSKLDGVVSKLGEVQNAAVGGIQGMANAISDTMANSAENISGLMEKGFSEGGAKAVQALQIVAAAAQAVGETVIGVLEMVEEIQNEKYEAQLERLSEQHEAEIEAIDERLAREIELIENNGMTKKEARNQEIASLQQQLATETDATKQKDLQEKISALQKEQKIAEAQQKALDKKEKAEKKYAKKKYQMEVQQFETAKQLEIIMTTINYLMGLVSIWANVWQLGPIAGLVMGAVLTALLTGFFAASVAMIASKQPPPPPAFAKGTDFAPGGLALVGERGAEMMNVPRGSQIFDADKTNAMLNPKITVDNNLYIGEEQFAIATSRTQVMNQRYERNR